MFVSKGHNFLINVYMSNMTKPDSEACPSCVYFPVMYNLFEFAEQIYRKIIFHELIVFGCVQHKASELQKNCNFTFCWSYFF